MTSVVEQPAAAPLQPTARGVDFKGLAIVVAVGLALWMVPRPVGVEPRAWHLLAIFVATVVGLIVKPLPLGGLAFVALGVF